MWDSEVLSNCIVVRIKGRIPKIAGLHGREIKLDNTFFLRGLEGDKMFLYRNLGDRLSDNEKKIIEGETGNDSGVSVIGDSILKLSVLDYFEEIINMINEIPGFRAHPCVLFHSSDMYLQIDYDEDSLEMNSEAVMKIVNSLTEKNEIVYIGKHPANFPYLIKLYKEFGCNMSDLTLVQTEWTMTEEEIEKENNGVFQNNGILIPKYFTNGEQDTILFRLALPEVKGNVNFVPANNSGNLIEMKLESKFFSDIYREIIMSYFGTLFYQAEVKNGTLTSNFVIDTSLLNQFLLGLKRHWGIDTRRSHDNVISTVKKLT